MLFGFASPTFCSRAQAFFTHDGRWLGVAFKKVPLVDFIPRIKTTGYCHSHDLAKTAPH